MNLTVGETGEIELRSVFNPIRLESASGEQLIICMRDSGFEFTYEGVKYRAVDGNIEKVKLSLEKPDDVSLEKMVEKLTSVNYIRGDYEE